MESIIYWSRWFKQLPQNPIYLREKGEWGHTNLLYKKALGLSPFVLLAIMVVALCTSVSGLNLYSELGFYMIMWCILWLPNLIITTLSLFASFILPTLTAPSISAERVAGSWDILRTTPQSTESILMAKLFANLSKFWMWKTILLLSIPQVVASVIAIPLSPPNTLVAQFIYLLHNLLRAPLEILFAALLGLFFSTTIRSAVIALISSYIGIVLFRLLNNNILWSRLFNWLLSNAELSDIVPLSQISITAVYITAVIALFVGTIHQAKNLTD